MPESDTQGRDRRSILKAIAAASTAGALAGCTDGGDTGSPTTTTTEDTTMDDDGTTTTDGENELGERVPPVVLSYPSILGTWQEGVPLIKEHVESALDITVETKPLEVPTWINDQRNDKRNYHYSAWRFDGSPTYYDLGATARSFVADWAGANNKGNWANYANCEYSTLVMDATRTTDPDERLEKLREALTIYSNDRVDMPLFSADKIGVIRSDKVNASGLGQTGAVTYNVEFMTQTTPKSGDRWVIGTTRDFHQSKNFLQIDTDANLSPWFWLIHSPLMGFDNDRELVPILAESYDVEGDTVTFNIKDDATFHNGDPVTAEHVKFTYETINGNNVPAQTVQLDFDSIEIVDDKTIEFSFATPAPTFVTQFAATWGIMHKPTWEAMDDPASFVPDTVVGSGPFQLASFTKQQSMTLAPHPEGHPVYDPNNTVVIFEFDDSQARIRSFQENEVQVLNDVVGSAVDQMQRQMPESQLQVSIAEGIGPFKLLPSYPRAPVRFNEFADAVGMSINRQELNEVVTGGRSQVPLYSSMYLANHPQSPPEDELHHFTDQPSGEPDRAKQVLQDAGWGYDDQGNLRYPADKDLSPLWPKGETPSAEDFPCLDEMGG